MVFQFCLGMMQRLITQQAVDQKGARYITDTLWLLMESGIEEVKVLQTVTLLLTSNAVVHGDTLARVRIYLHTNICSYLFLKTFLIHSIQNYIFPELGALFSITFHKRLYNDKYSWCYCKTISIFGV